MIGKLNLCLLTMLAIILVQPALGQSAELEDVRVATSGTTVSVEVDLTQTITPTVTYARNPDRMIMDFPGVQPKQGLHRVAVHQSGVGRVRVGLNRSNPPITRVVVDVDALRPFSIEANGEKFSLKILTSKDPLDQEADSEAENSDIEAVPSIAELPPGDNAAALQINDSPIGISEAKALLVDRQFRIKGISADSVYIDGGSNAGLKQGMRLMVTDAASRSDDGTSGNEEDVAQLRVLAVATTSAVAEVHNPKRPLKRGDCAVLVPEDAEKARDAVTSKALATVPLPRGQGLLPEQSGSKPVGMRETTSTSRMRGRIGLDYSAISSDGSTPGFSRQMGISVQSDMTKLFGTHWNLEGYWRGRINRHSQFQEDTIENTLNKTYTMQLYYDNPDSAWVAGFGRLYLPWAVSLDTIDGGYFGRKLGRGVTTGVFTGSTPDITSWDYRPDHQIAGSFVNFTGGDYEGFHLSSTSGIALGTIDWKPDRPFVFSEHEGSYKNFISVFHSLIADAPQGVSTNGIRPGAGISHSYLTIHLQPSPRVSFDIYHNYFRDVPTAPTQIIGTGLVDKLLFQGLSAGVHVEVVRHVTVYSTFGRNVKTGDPDDSLNQMYGIIWSEIAHTGLRADFHYSEFASNFADGNYRLLSLSRQLSNRTFFNLQFGRQSLESPFTRNSQSNFVASSMDVNLGKHSFIQTGYTFVNGSGMNYRQWYTSWGFRFDQGKGEAERNPITK